MKSIFKNKIIFGLIALIVVLGIGIPAISYAVNTYTIPNVAFKDENFYKCVVDYYNSEHQTQLAYSESLTDSQLQDISKLLCSDREIKDISGIEKLTNANYIDLSDNNLSNVDLSQNAKVVTLYLNNNKLSDINLTKLTNLSELRAGNNYLKEINLGKNVKLKNLEISNNQLSKIDVSNLIDLYSFHADNNRLETIDLSKNSKLAFVDLSYNNLSSIDFSKNPDLYSLVINHNYLSNINLEKNTKLYNANLSDNNLKNISINNNPDLEYLNVSYNNLTSLNVHTSEKLDRLLVDGNPINILEVANNNAIAEDFFIDNVKYQVSKLVVGSSEINLNNSNYKLYFNQKITVPSGTTVENIVSALGNSVTLNIYYITSAMEEKTVSFGEVKDEYRLRILANNAIDYITDVEIEILDNSAFEDKTFYQCVVDAVNDKWGTDVDINEVVLPSNLAKLETLDCSNSFNKITSTKGIELLTGLKELNLSNQQIREIDLSKNTELKNVNLKFNLLSNLNLSNNINLNSLSLDYNLLPSLDVSMLKKLSSLSATHNYITEIDLPSQLEELEIFQNNLEVLDIRNLYDLNSLKAGNNPLVTLKKNDNAIEELHVNNTKLYTLDLSDSLEVSTLEYNGDILLYNLNTKVEDLDYLNASSYIVRNDKNVDSDESLKTGDIYYSDEEILIAVKGDVAQKDGKLRINDIAKMYNILKEKTAFTDVEKAAGDLDLDGKIKINDVAKAYNYLKGNVNEL